MASPAPAIVRATTTSFGPKRLAFALVALLLTGSSLVAHAQPAQPVALPTVAAPDTVAALHRLFAHKRKKLLPLVAGTVAADVAGVAIIGSTVEGGGLIDGRLIGQVLTSIVGVVVVSAEVLFYTTAYGKQSEQRAVAAFAAHQLPRHLKRQLKARYFQEAPH